VCIPLCPLWCWIYAALIIKNQYKSIAPGLEKVGSWSSNFYGQILFWFIAELYLCSSQITTTMFEQVIGDGANIFITIVAVLVGFATALGYLDFLKTKKQEKKD
jgi:hypothetical protein